VTSIDYLACLDSVQNEIRSAFAIADNHHSDVAEGSPIFKLFTEIASKLQDADVILEQSLHALREEGPCEDCGFRMQEEAADGS
jgi:hypothetical protein